jgi:hypothetical protein
MIQHGIRSGIRKEYQWINVHNTLRKSRARFSPVLKLYPKTFLFI